MRKILYNYNLIISVILFTVTINLHGQQKVDFTVNMPATLTADAGNDIYLNPGQSSILGGSPTASGGITPYNFFWSPGAFLNDSTIANPLATPLFTINYTLQVTDYNNCSAIDSVEVFIPVGINNENNYLQGADEISAYYTEASKRISVRFPASIDNQTPLGIIILSSNGKIIHSAQLYLNEYNQLELPYEGSAGLIFLNISGRDFQHTIKILCL